MSPETYKKSMAWKDQITYTGSNTLQTLIIIPLWERLKPEVALTKTLVVVNLQLRKGHPKLALKLIASTNTKKILKRVWQITQCSLQFIHPSKLMVMKTLKTKTTTIRYNKSTREKSAASREWHNHPNSMNSYLSHQDKIK